METNPHRSRTSAQYSLKKESWFWGSGESTQKLEEQVLLASQHNTHVLIIGETGTGKEWIARQLSELRQKRLGLSNVEAPFVPVNCGAIPESLIESILFGHERGAFTSARERQLGKFELARKGTLFLDEIQTLPLHCQIKLLRVLQEKEVERLGAKEPVKLQCQIIAASNIPLEILVTEGKFRKDLYFRLNVLPVYIPSLRNREKEIKLIAESMLQKITKEHRLSAKEISEEAYTMLQKYSWPGNLRELEHALFYASLRAHGSLEKKDFPWTVNGELKSFIDSGEWKI